jgi:hypothetical protein
MTVKSLQLTATILLLFIVSCKKDNSTPLNQTTPQKTKTEILIAKTWIVKEAYDMQGNTLNKFTRGGNNNTHNLDNDELTFKGNHTGNYKDASGQTYNLTWNLINSDSSKMTVTIQYPTPIVLNYDMVNLFENSFTATHNYVNGSGQKVLASFHRVYK